MTSFYLNEMYDVIGINVFLRKLMRFHALKRIIQCLPHYCGCTFRAVNELTNINFLLACFNYLQGSLAPSDWLTDTINSPA